MDQRYESLRIRLEQVVSQINDRTRSRFTREDADKISLRIKEIDDEHSEYERQMLERLTGVQLKIIALETRDNSDHEIAKLKAEVENLRAYVAPRPTRALAGFADPVLSGAAGNPVQLPSISRR